MIKDIINDLRKFSIDNEINNKEILVMNDLDSKKMKWSDIQCGDVLKIFKQMEIPADIILLSTSNMNQKVCYVSTSNVDGQG